MTPPSIAPYGDRLLKLRDRLARAAGVRRLVGGRRFAENAQPSVLSATRALASAFPQVPARFRERPESLRGKEPTFPGLSFS